MRPEGIQISFQNKLSPLISLYRYIQSTEFSNIISLTHLLKPAFVGKPTNLIFGIKLPYKSDIHQLLISDRRSALRKGNPS